MKDDYLWDGSGEPDPQVQKLETVLGRYRHNQPAPAFDQIAEIGSVKHRWRFLNLRLSVQLGAVAAGSGSLSSAERFTLPAGRRRANLSWIRLPLSLWT